MDRIKSIAPLDQGAILRAREKWDSIAKPLRSLGLLEDCIAQIAGIAGNENFALDKRCVVVMCADNGVVSEGVTQTGSEVTAIVAQAIAEGRSNISLLAGSFGADVAAVDMGMNGDIHSDKIILRKMAHGTRNIANGEAMSSEQAKKAISAGIDIARDMKFKGYDIVVTGEMGIGNTTTAAAIASVLLCLPPAEVTGRGSGLTSEGLQRKISVIERSIAVNSPDKDKPLELLAKLGGFDIAGMAGLFLGGAIYRVPVVIDGFISAVAAAIAAEICPNAREFMLCSHVSAEPAGIKILEYLGMKPVITAGMRLGEGTGGVMLLPLMDGALTIYNSAHRFDSLPMERYVELK